MPALRPASRLNITFEGFHQHIPDLSVPAGGGSEQAAQQFRHRVAEHVVRYMRTRNRDQVKVVGNPDSPEGHVEVDGGSGQSVQAGRFHVAPDALAGGAPVSAGVPLWVWMVAALVLAILLL